MATHPLIQLVNPYWQAGILPATGASVAYGRAWNGKTFVDVMRPTPPADYGNSSSTASFIMLPWANRIGGGKLSVDGTVYQLRTTPDDGTARHGDTRSRTFTVTSSAPDSVTLTLDSRTQPDMNWPFAFRTEITYRLSGASFIWTIALTNEDNRAFPAGFGHHPYFVRPNDQPIVQIPANRQFTLINAMAYEPAIPVPPDLDFRAPRKLLPDEVFDNLLTERIDNAPAQLAFPDRSVTLSFRADPLFAHWIIYAPVGKPFFAVEPQTNANDGFALDEKGIAGSGTFTLAPGQTISAEAALTIV